MSKRKVLVVDDEERIRKLVILYLEADDYEITEADRGILLSPAAASYNTYKDFTERGLDFVNEIKQQAERI